MSGVQLDGPVEREKGLTMETMTRKTIELGKVDGYGNGRKSCMADVEVEITDRNGYPELSICGDIWNNLHTNIIMGGQCLDTILGYFPRSAKVQRIVEVWERWHLNGMHAECEHQRALGWTWTTHPGEPCPECGYKLGSAWLREDLPAEIIEEVRGW